MGTFINIAQFITSLGLLILLHEFGHFITARMFKIRVDKFYMFFDFLLFLSMEFSGLQYSSHILKFDIPNNYREE